MNKDKLKKMSVKLSGFIYFSNYIFARIAGINKSFEKAILRPLMTSFTKHSKESIVRYSVLPKNVEQIDCYEDRDFSSWAIVMQGPILYENNFTIDSIILYKRLFPNVKIIVSTWIGVTETFRKRCEELDIILLENKEPVSSGLLNTNYQLISSRNGVSKAKEIGCKYCIKTRNDQRMYARDALSYMKNLLDVFPCIDSKKKRVIFTSVGTSYRTRPFCLCDFVLAGAISDVLNFYSTDEDDKTNEKYKTSQNKIDEYIITFRRELEPFRGKNVYDKVPDLNEIYFEYMCPEEYLAFNYCDRNCFKINGKDDLLKQYNMFLAHYAIVVDEGQLQLYWPKYLEIASQDLNEYDYFAKLDFKKWLDIKIDFEKDYK